MKSKYRVQRLGNFITEISVRNNRKSVSEVFSVTNSEGFIRSTDYFDKEVFSKNISNYKIVKPNQFAYNPSRINVGSISFLKERMEVAVSPLYIVFQCKEKLLPEYLLHYLKSPLGIRQIRSKTRGAVRDSLSYKSIEEIKIPIPSLDEQLKIVKLFSKVESIIEQRNESITILDNVIKNQFYKLFGNPLINEKNWNIEPLNKFLIDIIAGSSTGGEHKEEMSANEVGILKISAVTKGRFNSKEFKVVQKDKLGIRLVNPEKGDLLFSRANTRELVGATCIVDEYYPRLYLPDKLWKLVINETYINKVYLHYLFQNPSFKNKISSIATGSNSSMLNISMEKLREINIPIPPIALQDKLAMTFSQIESIRKYYENSLVNLNKVAESVSSRAYSGELNLSNIQIENVVPKIWGGNNNIANKDIITKSKNLSIGNKGSVLRNIASRYFKYSSFSFEELAQKIQLSLTDIEYNYDEIKQQVFAALRGEGDIVLEHFFDEKEKKLLLRIK